MTKLFTSWLLLTMLSINVVATHTTDARDEAVRHDVVVESEELNDEGEEK